MIVFCIIKQSYRILRTSYCIVQVYFIHFRKVREMIDLYLGEGVRLVGGRLQQ